jgi:Tfp pilus assembly protein PilZ
VRETLIQQFISYIAVRGIPEEYHELYRNEAAVILSMSRVGSIEDLDAQRLKHAVKEAERRLKTRAAVVTAIEAFLRHWNTAPDQESSEGIPDSLRTSPAVLAPSAARPRMFVRVPFNRAIDVAGSRGGNRGSDISMGGLYIETRSIWNIGDVIDTHFRLHAADPEALHLSARVVYVDPGVGVGVDFIEPPAATRRAIRHYVEEIIGRRQHAPR